MRLFLGEGRRAEGGAHYYTSARAGPETLELVDVLKKQFEQNFGLPLAPLEPAAAREMYHTDDLPEEMNPFSVESEQTKLVRFMVGSADGQRLR